MKNISSESNKPNPFKDSEIWYQDPEDTNLWHGKHGVIINTAALNEREFYYTVVRIPSKPAYQQENLTRAYA
jgi:hypothetical protein